MIVAILAVSILLQLIAAVAALRLIPITGRRLGWAAIAAAVLLMAMRSSITFVRLLTGDGGVQPDPAAELVALTISVLIVVGILWIVPGFSSIRGTNRAKEVRQGTERRYKHLFETMHEGFALHEIITDSQGEPVDYRFLEVNPAFERMTGLKAEEVMGERITEVLPDLEEEWIQTYGEVALGGEQKSFESYSRELGRHYAVDAFSPKEGQFATVFLDITDRVHAEKALRESEEHFRALTEGSLTGVYIIQDGILRYANAGLAETFGYEQEEIIDTLEISDLIHPDDWPFVAENLRRRMEGETGKIRYEFRGVRKDGSTIYCEVLGRRADHDGRPAVVGTLIDTTERKGHEQRIERQVKLLDALRQIDLAISASLDPGLTFEVLLTQVTEQLDIDAADILAFDHRSQTLNFAAGKGFRTEAVQDTHLELGESYAGEAALNREVVSIPDLAEEGDGPWRSRHLSEEGFVSYYAVPLNAKGSVEGILEIFHRERLDPDEEWTGFLQALAGQAAIAIENAMLFDELNRSNQELRQAYDSTLEGWAHALELRDFETEGHSQRVTELAMKLARAMGIEASEITQVRRGALLHDIGKIGIPDAILHKPGKLDEEEWEEMRAHPRYAYELLGQTKYLKPALDIPYCHHEKWDGTGYPRGLKGKEIPLFARIFAIVDVWDALRTDRPYREALSDEEALTRIQNERGKHFDPAVVDAFVDLIGSS